MKTTNELRIFELRNSTIKLPLNVNELTPKLSEQKQTDKAPLSEKPVRTCLIW